MSNDGRQLRDASSSKSEYALRINRVLDHIDANLGGDLTLESLAKVAHFSKFHFHRIFGVLVGETMNQYVQRLRVEGAANRLVANCEMSITEIALDCGFSSSATFARAFKEHYQMSASQWRDGGSSKVWEQRRKNRNVPSNECEAALISRCYICPETSNPTWSVTMPSQIGKLDFQVDVQDLPARDVVYIRHIGPYGDSDIVPQLIDKLHKWAIPRGLLGADTLHILVPHDNPNITDPSKLRLSVCLSVPEGIGTLGDGEIGAMVVAGGQFAVGRFEIPPARIGEAWDAIIGGWLPQSGYQPDDRFCYEVARNNPREHPEGKILLDICVPVRPL